MTRRDLEIRRNLIIPASELTESASRSGGSGGQHVNKTSTRVTLRWNVRDSAALSAAQRTRLLTRLGPRLTGSGALVVHSGRRRSRSQNREAARERLAELVRDALRVARHRVPTSPSRGAREGRLTDKKRRSQTKEHRTPPTPDD